MEKKDLPIAAPCNADWRTMTPSDGGRFCGDCKKVVRDLSSMRERDARTLLRSPHNAELCVRFLYDRHGKVFFGGDQAQPLVPATFLQRAKRVALTAAAVAVPLSLQACSPSDSHADGYGEMMGGMEMSVDKPVDADDGGADGATTIPDRIEAAPKRDRGDAGADATADAETPI